MYKIVKIALLAAGVIGAILWFLLPDSDMPKAEASQSGTMSAMFMLTYLLLGIAIVFSLFFSLKNQLSNPASLKKTLFGVGGFLLVVIVSYVLASGSDVSVDEMANRGISTTEGTIKQIGMGLNIFFILTVVAIVLMLAGGFKKMTSK